MDGWIERKMQWKRSPHCINTQFFSLCWPIGQSHVTGWWMCRKEFLSYFVKVWRPVEWLFSINKHERRKSGSSLSSSLSGVILARAAHLHLLFYLTGPEKEVHYLLITRRNRIIIAPRVRFSKLQPPKEEVGWMKAEVKYIFTAKLFLALYPPCGHKLSELLTGCVFNLAFNSSTSTSPSVFIFTVLFLSSN